MNIDLVRILEKIHEDIFEPATPEDIKQREEAHPLIPFEKLVKPGPVEVWYMRPETFRDLIMGVEWAKEHGGLPDPNNLEKTHILLGTTAQTDPELIFSEMQGENWSPHGEARKLISSKGLHHTSMSVGDIVVTADGSVLMADNIYGFHNLGKRN